MRKASRLIAAVGATFLLCSGMPLAGASPKPLVLTYSIREARAYAFKVSLSKQELQLIPPCDPSTDPYKCDTSQYEHKPNCPPQIALGRTRPGPAAQPASQSIVVSGGASDHVGAEPNQSSPVRLNRLLSLGRLGHSGAFPSAGGFASDQYVDLNGRRTPAAHTQSEAFSNLSDYEERCNPVPQSGSASYEHFLSRSGDGPATYHLSECFGSQCTFGAGVSVEHARSVVDLHEKDGVVTATIQSELQGLDLVPGMLGADVLSTFISVRSDGTPSGLKWSVATTLLGLNLAGQKVALPIGATIPLQSLTIGIVPPFVLPSDGGHVLSIVAPGLAIMSDQQSVFLGGAELYGSFNREPPVSFNPVPSGILPLPPIPPIVLPSVAPPPPLVTPQSPVPASAQFAIRMYDTGQAAVAAILAAGGAALLLVLARWSRRWAWGRRLCHTQPFKGIDWLYRAFVKT